MAVLDDAAFGAATPVRPKFVSPADPAARWTGAHGGQAFFAYSANYLIDLRDHLGRRAYAAIRQAEGLSRHLDAVHAAAAPWHWHGLEAAALAAMASPSDTADCSPALLPVPRVRRELHWPVGLVIEPVQAPER